ncbi:GAF domain-containing protein [Deinococcus reticulitermitis]|uniref:GAF domain-containing protein n=1 Tax=Deinococcus reticulitermitis TaxID=856736 RepID=A0A1H7A0J8_9DEIO|nr:GAF domain-containing protein [Deinococcus reticulitermitis]
MLSRGPCSIPDIDAYLDAQPQRVRRLVSETEVVLDVRAQEALPPPPNPVLSMLLVPLKVQGEAAGVLSLQSHQTHAFDATDLEFLELLGQHVAIALENAALREAHAPQPDGPPDRAAQPPRL